MNSDQILIRSLTVSELSSILSSSEDEPLMLDVREQEEFTFCRIEGAKLCPLSDFESNLSAMNLDKTKKIVIYCHHGKRSLAAYMFMTQKGFENLYNLEGGIDAWSNEIDASVQKY
jgi:rhodanese-related sulfurtransferase